MSTFVVPARTTRSTKACVGVKVGLVVVLTGAGLAVVLTGTGVVLAGGADVVLAAMGTAACVGAWVGVATPTGVVALTAEEVVTVTLGATDVDRDAADAPVGA